MTDATAPRSLAKPFVPADVRHGQAADRLSFVDEALADVAFLNLSRLRDRLVGQDENTAACRVDEAIEKLEDACRELRGDARKLREQG